MTWVDVNDEPPPKDGTIIVGYDPTKPNGSNIELLHYKCSWESLHYSGYRGIWNITHYQQVPKYLPGGSPINKKQVPILSLNPVWRSARGLPPLTREELEEWGLEEEKIKAYLKKSVFKTKRKKLGRRRLRRLKKPIPI